MARQNIKLFKVVEHEDIKKQGHLTKETSNAVIHTVDTLVLLVKYLLQQHKLQFVLLVKF